ncbi:hypothetical protein R5R35_005416 [Gryllus longicercus]|uniref:Uncharacterized protein n=1 Tax=Gryllus longicercus TaxID=2509291 RepID=A0AAN9Z5S0_9ORTH
MRGMMNEILQILGRENRCVGVILLVFGVIQVLLLSALLLPEDPLILESQPYPSSTGKVHLAFKSIDAATQEVKNANATVPTDRIGENPAANISENEDRIAAEPADNSTTRGDGMGPPGTVIISPDSLEVVPKLYDQPAASGIGIKPPEMTTAIDIKEDYKFIPFPGSTRAVMQTQPPIAIPEFGSKATTEDKEKSIDSGVNSALRFGQGWKDIVAKRIFKYDVAGAKVNRLKPSAANDLGQREALPAMNGLALYPQLDRLYWAARRERVRTAPVATTAAAP